MNGRNILNVAGNPVLLRGVNNMSVFDEEDPNGAVDFPEIAKTGANTVRIVWAMVNDRDQTTDPAVMNTLIQNARNAGLVPMIELHDATGDLSKLPQLTAYWTRNDVVNVINTHSQYVLLNIGNEVGDDNVDAPQFISAYTTSIQAIRAAGIKVPLVIDAPDFGKKLEVLNAAAAQLLAADPLHNLIFSVHTYWGITDGATPAFIKQQFEAAVALNYPLIIGEFSKYGAFNGNQSICAEPGGLCDYVTIVAEANRLGIGWYAWEWGPGNEFGGAGCDEDEHDHQQQVCHASRRVGRRRWRPPCLAASRTRPSPPSSGQQLLAPACHDEGRGHPPGRLAYRTNTPPAQRCAGGASFSPAVHSVSYDSS